MMAGVLGFAHIYGYHRRRVAADGVPGCGNFFSARARSALASIAGITAMSTMKTAATLRYLGSSRARAFERCEAAGRPPRMSRKWKMSFGYH